MSKSRNIADIPNRVVNVLDFPGLVGDGVANDAAAYQAGVFANPNTEIFYPAGTIINTAGATILWLGEQTHRFAKGAKIVGDVAASAVRVLGYPDLLTATVSAPIAREDISFDVSSASELSAGDDFYFYDVSTAEYDVNTVRKVVGSTIFTKYPVNYNFATAGDIRLYSLANAARNTKVFGGEIQNINADLGAHGITFLNTTDCVVDGLTVTNTGGIGIEWSVSMRYQSLNVTAKAPGSTGHGSRNVRDFIISNYNCTDPNRDEGLTFYKNCTFGTILNPTIRQYLNGEEPGGNAGLAGNCILLDERCCDITIDNPKLRGSATYAIFINNGSDRNRVINPDIDFANLGGIRIAVNSNNNVVQGGWIRNITNLTDTEQAGIATAAIQDGATCAGNVLGDGTQYSSIAALVVRQSGGKPMIPNRAAFLIARDQKINGSNGGASVAATQNPRELNVVDFNSIPGATLGSNRVTLPAGAYRVTASAPVYRSDRTRLRLRDITNSATLVLGTSQFFTSGATGEGAGIVVLEGVFTLSAATVLELQHYTQTDNGTGLGVAGSTGDLESYAQISFARLP